MSIAKITLIGNPAKEPKVNENGAVELLFKIPISETVPNGLENFRETVYKVFVSKKSWSKISSIVNNDSVFIIQGETKAAVNSKGIPFIKILCSDISIQESKIKQNSTKKELYKETLMSIEAINIDNINKILPEGTEDVISLSLITLSEVHSRVNPKNKNYKEALEYIKTNECFQRPVIIEKFTNRLLDGADFYWAARNLSISKVPVIYKTPINLAKRKEDNLSQSSWYIDEEIIEINTNDIILTEPVHLNTTEIKLVGFKSISKTKQIKLPVAVRCVEDGKYSLVAGLSRYIIARTLGIDKIPAVIKNMSHTELALEYKFENYKHTKVMDRKSNNTCNSIELNQIIIPSNFISSPPSTNKINAAIDYYNSYGELDKPIRVSKSTNELIDGYTRFIAAKTLGLDKVRVDFINK